MIKQNSKERHSVFHRFIDPDFIDLFYQASILNHFPIVAWQLPGKNERQAIIDLSRPVTQIDMDLSKIQPGFIFTPFLNSGIVPSLFLKANLFLNNSRCIYCGDNAEEAHNKLLFENTLINLLNNNGKNGENQTAINGSKGLIYISRYGRNTSVTKEQFCHWVEQAKKQIKKDKLKKVVLTRTVEVELEEDFGPLSLFKTLCIAYPNAFISLVAIPGIGTWIGATPELLLSVNRRELLTVALAATKTVSFDTELSNVIWGDKELKEQAFVSDYVRNCFLQQGIHDFIEHETETMRAGNLLHLQTRFQLELSQDNLHERANRFLKELHPTPAICGVPKTAALDFILDHESHDREFYTGYLGPVNIDSQSHLFVNLRCMQLKGDTAILYAGSGITIDSEPEKEWLEAELKLSTLLDFLNKKLSTTIRKLTQHSGSSTCNEKV